jgi:3-methylcrotonyl-CoA carboxylase alpha subunit
MGAMTRVTRGQAAGELIVRDGERVTQLFAVSDGKTVWVFERGSVHEFPAVPDAARRRAAAPAGALTAPMPATVIAIKVAAGDTVKHGQVLLLLEAMKMELPVRAPGDGRVKAIHCKPGELVQPETPLIELE